jgi:hypothetical protein
MEDRRIWFSAAAVVSCVFIAMVIWRERMPTDRAILSVPISNRFEAVVPFRRHECIEVVSRRNDRIFVEDIGCSPSEFSQRIRQDASNDLSIKAVVLILGVDGSAGFQSLERALLSTVPKHLKIYYFHESSYRSIEYFKEQN